MEFYESKKAILEHCWKDGKDVRWLDRAIKDGRIGICEGDYYVVSEYVTHLEEENWELEDTIASLRKQLAEKGENKSDLKAISKAMGEKVLSHGEINNLKMDNADLKDHLKFFYEMDLARKEAMNNVVQAYYDKNPNDWWDNAVEKANAFMKFSENQFEADEIEYVKWIIN